MQILLCECPDAPLLVRGIVLNIWGALLLERGKINTRKARIHYA